MPHEEPTAESVRALAPGKINLLLHVGPPEQDGYHGLLTCFHAVDVWETVTVTPAESYSVSISGDVNLGEVPLDEDNLVIKAARAVTTELGVTDAAAIHIHKRVPVGGGMGGGSADAAATLVAMNEMLSGGLSQAALLGLAQALGADVPFLLEGNSALGRGRGGDLEPIESLPFWWVITPSVSHLSTPEVYRILDQQRVGTQPTLPAGVSARFRRALLEGNPEMLAGHLTNELQPAALAVVPSLRHTLNRGLELGALATMVSGSGPTSALLARDEEHAQILSAEMNAEGFYSFPTSSPARGAHLVPLG